MAARYPGGFFAMKFGMKNRLIWMIKRGALGGHGFALRGEVPAAALATAVGADGGFVGRAAEHTIRQLDVP